MGGRNLSVVIDKRVEAKGRDPAKLAGTISFLSELYLREQENMDREGKVELAREIMDNSIALVRASNNISGSSQ